MHQGQGTFDEPERCDQYTLASWQKFYPLASLPLPSRHQKEALLSLINKSPFSSSSSRPRINQRACLSFNDRDDSEGLPTNPATTIEHDNPSSIAPTAVDTMVSTGSEPHGGPTDRPPLPRHDILHRMRSKFESRHHSKKTARFATETHYNSACQPSLEHFDKQQILLEIDTPHADDCCNKAVPVYVLVSGEARTQPSAPGPRRVVVHCRGST